MFHQMDEYESYRPNTHPAINAMKDTIAAVERKISICAHLATMAFQFVGGASTLQSLTIMLMGTVPKNANRKNAVRAASAAHA